MEEWLWKATTVLRVWTSGTFIEPRILLQIDSTLQLSGCYVNDNDSMSLLTSYSVTIYK